MTERETPKPGDGETVLHPGLADQVRARMAEEDAKARQAKASGSDPERTVPNAALFADDDTRVSPSRAAARSNGPKAGAGDDASRRAAQADQPTQAIPRVQPSGRRPTPGAAQPVQKPVVKQSRPAQPPAAAQPARPATTPAGATQQVPVVAQTAPQAPQGAAAVPATAKSPKAPKAERTQKAKSPASSGGSTRKARLRLVKIDPWSVMKTSFLLSVAFGVVTFVAVAMVWSVLGMAGVWDSVNEAVSSFDTKSGSAFDITDYVGTGRVLGFTALISVVNVVLLTALATLTAFLYNLAAALLGGFELTFAEERH